MASTPIYTPYSSEEQVQWVLMPVRVPAPSTFPPAPNAAGKPWPSYSPMLDFAAYPSMWDQQHAAPPYPALLPRDDVHSDAFDIDLALRIDAAIHPDYPSLSGLGVDASASFDSVLSLDMAFPVAPSFTDGALLGDIWQGSSSSASGSSVGSPAVTTSPFGATNTPCSTPPTLELRLCSEPSCFEAFSKAADLRCDHPTPTFSARAVASSLGRRHERKHRQNFCCPICQKPHLDKRALDRHLWSRHEGYAIKVGAKSEKTKCSVCDYVSRADNVRRHERSQHSAADAPRR